MQVIVARRSSEIPKKTIKYAADKSKIFKSSKMLFRNMFFNY